MSGIMTRVGDGLRSLIGGLGDPLRDKGASTRIYDVPITDEELSASYENNWVSKKAVDIPAKDALRKWRRHNSDKADEIAALEVKLGLRKKVSRAVVSGRLFGAAVLYIGTDQEPSEPLDVSRIGAGGLKYVAHISRRYITPGELETDILSEMHGRPSMYRVQSKTGEVPVHPSRLVIFRGDDPADEWGATSAHAWGGVSILKATREAIHQFASANSNIASLLFEANVDSIGIPQLADHFRRPNGEQELIARLSLAAQNKSINGMLVHDADEKYQRSSASFADLSPTMETFALFAAAANDIPATRFLARSPTGLIATGGHDMANYHDKLQSMQELDIGPAMSLLDECLVRSAGAGDVVDYEWLPFEQMNEEEQAKIGLTTVEALEKLHDMGIYTVPEMRRLATHRLAETNAFPHIEEEIGEGNGTGVRLDGQSLSALVGAVAADRAPEEAVTEYLRSVGMLRDLSPEQVRASINEARQRQSLDGFGARLPA